VCVEVKSGPPTLFLQAENVRIASLDLAFRVLSDIDFMLQAAIFWCGIFFVQDGA